MTGKEQLEFLDKLFYGAELLIEYRGSEYFVQGWINDGYAEMVLEKRNGMPFTGYIWQTQKKSMKECADEFLASKLWDKQTFTQVWRDVTWKD